MTYNYVMNCWTSRTRFGGTYTKIGTIQRRLAWPLAQGWHANSWSVPLFSSPPFLWKTLLTFLVGTTDRDFSYLKLFVPNKPKYVVLTIRNFGFDVLLFFRFSRPYCYWVIGIVMSSVCPSVTLCIMAKWYIIQEKCLNKWIGSAMWEHDFTTFNPSAPKNYTA